jgi:hypothetical protein
MVAGSGLISAGLDGGASQGGQQWDPASVLIGSAGSQAKDDACKDHPYTGDGGARFRESSEMPWPWLEVLLREQAASNRDPVGDVGSQDGQGEDRAEKG